jgi:hydroxymethylbilane synthase
MMIKNFLTIATRESPLALWQAHWVKFQLEKHHPHMDIKLLGLTTIADKMLDTPLLKIGGKGLFVKELEEALLDGRADIAVHSMKDVPMELPLGLSLSVMCEREDPRDAFVSIKFDTLEDLPVGAILGTSSLRRQSQLARLRPDIEMRYLRGNVNTRLERLEQGDYAAIILAAAGLKRLNLQKYIRSYLSVEQSLPAAGQGVLGIECRLNDIETQKLIALLDDTKSRLCVTAERALCRRLGGGCHVPVAAYADIVDDKIFLRGLVANPQGTRILRSAHTDHIDNASQLGMKVADELIAQGALDILALLGK